MKQVFMDQIGFTDWKQLRPEDVLELTGRSDIGKVFLSPDVHSLHIVWEEDEHVRHEVADYDEDQAIGEFLGEHIGDDSWDDHEGADIYELISDFGNESAETTAVISLAELTQGETVNA